MQNRFGKFDAVFYQEIMLLSGVFRRETASGFYPWGNVVSPRERVAEGLCGWRHGNSFPMTQSAQSHRQMRSIPLCPKAVFYVFVFDSIHDSATMYNHCPSNFPLCQYRPVDQVDLVDVLTLGYTKMEAALFLVGKGEPPSLSSYFNFTFTCDLSIQRRREI